MKMDELSGTPKEELKEYKNVILKQLDRVNEAGSIDLQNNIEGLNKWINSIKILESHIGAFMTPEEIKGVEQEAKKNVNPDKDRIMFTKEEKNQLGREYISLLIREAHIRGLLGGGYGR